MILLGNWIDGEEAVGIGLADHLVAEDSMHEEFDDVVDRYMAANSEGSRLAKEAMLACFDLDYGDFLERYLGLQTRAMNSEDFEEAIAAYREERDPEWM